MIRRTLLSWFLDCQCAAAVTAWVLSTCVAHANPEAPYPKAVKTLSCSGTQCREKSSDIARECETKMSAEGKLENERELKNCVKNWMPTIANPAKGHWIWNWPPPAEFDKPYEGVLAFHRMPVADIQKICAHRFACAMVISTYNDGKLWALSVTGNRVACIILLPPDNVIKEHHQEPKDIIRHETAHCNGWPSDHPGSQSKWEWVEK